MAEDLEGRIRRARDAAVTEEARSEPDLLFTGPTVVSYRVLADGVSVIDDPNPQPQRLRVGGAPPGTINLTVEGVGATGILSEPSAPVFRMPPPRDLEQQADPNALYHYTTADAMLNILRERSFRATKLGYFSDGGELSYGLRLAERLIARRSDADTLAAPALQLLVKAFDQFREINIFVVSLSRRGDDLSQWRGYGGIGQGHAIELREDILTATGAQDGAWTIMSCDYEVRTQAAFLEHLISEYLSAGSSDRSIFNTALTIMASSMRMKHPSFKSEEEVRLVTSPVDETKEKIRYRPGTYTLIPYVDLVLPDTAFSSVTVGPTPHLELSMSATAGALRSIALSLPVTGASTSFRPW